MCLSSTKLQIIVINVVIVVIYGFIGNLLKCYLCDSLYVLLIDTHYRCCSIKCTMIYYKYSHKKKKNPFGVYLKILPNTEEVSSKVFSENILLFIHFKLYILCEKMKRCKLCACCTIPIPS